MILRVIHSRTKSGALQTYNVLYDSGRIKLFDENNIPETVKRFISGHHSHVRSRGDIVVKTYLYNEPRKRGINKHG